MHMSRESEPTGHSHRESRSSMINIRTKSQSCFCLSPFSRCKNSTLKNKRASASSVSQRVAKSTNFITVTVEMFHCINGTPRKGQSFDRLNRRGVNNRAITSSIGDRRTDWEIPRRTITLSIETHKSVACILIAESSPREPSLRDTRPLQERYPSETFHSPAPAADSDPERGETTVAVETRPLAN